LEIHRRGDINYGVVVLPSFVNVFFLGVYVFLFFPDDGEIHRRGELNNILSFSPL